MRRIHKSTEPDALTTHRASGGSFDGLHKQSIRPLLIADQRGLCCYCMQRLQDGPRSVKIEHFRPQSRHPELTLTWSNLFAACPGGMGLPPAQQHCDTAKGGRACALNPLTIQEANFSYRSDGTIVHRDPVLDQQLNEVLHLNTPALRRRRKATLDGFIRAMGKKKKGIWSRARLERELSKRLSQDPLDPFCAVIAGWLRRKIQQRA